MLSVILALLLAALAYRHAVVEFRLLLLESQLAALQKSLQSERKRLKLSGWFRRLWAWTACVQEFFGIETWKTWLVIVKPEQVIRWSRDWFTGPFLLFRKEQKRSPGRPPISEEAIELIRRMARDNPSWSPHHIQSALRKLGFRHHRQTIRKYMPVRDSNPINRLRWKAFLWIHMPFIAAMDFFRIESPFRGPMFGFVVIGHGRREILHINVTRHPSADWLQQQLLLAFPEVSHLRFLLSDNDVLFKPVSDFIEETLQLTRVRTQIASPWQNGITERFIRTLREELLQFLIPFSVGFVRQRLQEYAHFYNEERGHSFLDLEPPAGRPADSGPATGRVVAFPRVGGLHHVYRRVSTTVFAA